MVTCRTWNGFEHGMEWNSWTFQQLPSPLQQQHGDMHRCTIFHCVVNLGMYSINCFSYIHVSEQTKGSASLTFSYTIDMHKNLCFPQSMIQKLPIHEVNIVPS